MAVDGIVPILGEGFNGWREGEGGGDKETVDKDDRRVWFSLLTPSQSCNTDSPHRNK